MTLQPGTRLASYEITSLLGSGGMGEVYRAKDLKLGRDVAIKVLREELASDPERLRRFEQEARSASALNHPNIITIYDIGKHEATPFIAMEYVDGKTLREMLSEGPLPTKKLHQLATQIAEGLAKAHTAGIVHRDLKPENLMVTSDGYVKILDFGLAKLWSSVPETDSEAVTATREGNILGTVGYMSPEQAKGQLADYRSDQFSLGAILYEMATGTKAFRRDSAVQTLTAIIEHEPLSIIEVDPMLPIRLAQIVERCLEKDPEVRYDSTRDLARDIKSVEDLPHVPKVREIDKGRQVNSLVVLPLANLSPDPKQEYFSDGMTEALITDLAKISTLKVISRTSAMHYKNSTKTLPEIARELNVDAVVEGSVLRSGDRVRITAQLINAEMDEHLWADSYEEDLQDILRLQREVAQSIAREIKITLTGKEKELLTGARPVNGAAYEAYLRGRFFTNQYTPQGIQKGVEYFDRAITMDPTYAPAYAGLAYAYSGMGTLMTHPAQESFSMAKMHAKKALEIDETLAVAQTVLADAKMMGDWDWEGAEQSFRLAIDLGAGDAFAHWRYGTFLTPMGRTEESLAELRKAADLDPLSLNTISGLGMGLLFAGQYDDSIQQLQKVLEMDPKFALANIALSVNYTKKSLHAQAIAAASQAVADTERFPHFLAFLAFAYGSAGRKDETLAILEELIQVSKRGFVPSEAFVVVYGVLGEMDQTFKWLEKAFDAHGRGLVLLKTAPWLEPLRHDHRYEEFLRRMNFPD